jgi:mRNA-degrading endonuclease RelE of RelBE toxin-antitoxin system
MIFYETDIFTAQITKLISDESYTELQKVLIADPESGDLIRNSQGLRKIRWRLAGTGKSGGIRIIYYLVCGDEIFLLFAYPKNKQENITEEQARVLRALVDKHLPR